VVWALVGHNLEHQDTFEAADVAKIMSEPSPLERNLLSKGTGFDYSGMMDLYETISSEYCTPPVFKRPDPPAFEYVPGGQLVAEWAGPSLGIQFTFGACQSAGNKTLECVRPWMSMEKKPPSFAWKKDPKGFVYEKFPAYFVDKQCDFGGGAAEKLEEAVLYDGGSESYDLSGFRWDHPQMFSKGDMFKSRQLLDAIKSGYEDAAQAMRELDFKARSLGEGLTPSEEIKGMDFKIFEDEHIRNLFKSVSKNNGPKIFHN